MHIADFVEYIGEIDNPPRMPIMEVMIANANAPSGFYKCKLIFDFSSWITRIPQEAISKLALLGSRDPEPIYDYAYWEKKKKKVLVKKSKSFFRVNLYFFLPNNDFCGSSLNCEVMAEDIHYVLLGREILLKNGLTAQLSLTSNQRFLLDINERIKRFKGIPHPTNTGNNETKRLVQQAMLYHYQGDYETAEKFYKESSEKETSHSLGYALVLHQWGILAYDKGEDEIALGRFKKSISIKENENDKYGLALSYIQIGRLYQRKRDFDEAEKNYRMAAKYLAPDSEYKDVVNRYLKDCHTLKWLDKEITDNKKPLFEEETLLDIDLAGNTKKILETNQPLMEEFRQKYYELIENKTIQFNGKRFNTIGDEVISEFKSPEEAVSAAYSIQEAIPSLENNFPTLKPIKARIGVNSGCVKIDSKSNWMGNGTPPGEVTEPTIDIATKIQKKCLEGDVLVGEQTYRRLRNRSEFEEYKFLEDYKTMTYIKVKV